MTQVLGQGCGGDGRRQGGAADESMAAVHGDAGGGAQVRAAVIGSFRVPAAVLSVFGTLSVMLWVPLYDCAVVPLASSLTGYRHGFTQLARIGVGFVVLTVAMLLAGALEVARRRVLAHHGTYVGADGARYVPMSIFWQVPQYVVVGAAEVFTFIGQMEFFYDQAPDAMRSICSGLAKAARNGTPPIRTPHGGGSLKRPIQCFTGHHLREDAFSQSEDSMGREQTSTG
ncbi:protein NRT1/ PTR FAMILY 8.2-like [Lolium rigidum]|uniref:protein NRT1/ PTR FAMILY 8.2-like n=1 Tax=Lolium rigidum TaxID=89674 RepID=UPI001F5DBCA7|nr:protein NRT1/ PTR FAMILY 8.2-like [Lolium rigidum]